jgi:hypothetical protein
MKKLLIGLLLLASASVFSCSPSYLEKANIENSLLEKFGVDINNIEYLSFRETIYWGGETRREQCPRFRINGKAKVRLVVNGIKSCTLIAKENYSGNYSHEVRLKRIKCKSL